MRAEKIAELVPGDRVWWWFDDGMGGAQIVMPVVRVNRKTVTCTNGFGENIRVPHQQIDGRWIDPEDAAPPASAEDGRYEVQRFDPFWNGWRGITVGSAESSRYSSLTDATQVLHEARLASTRQCRVFDRTIGQAIR